MQPKDPLWAAAPHGVSWRRYFNHKGCDNKLCMEWSHSLIKFKDSYTFSAASASGSKTRCVVGWNIFLR